MSPERWQQIEELFNAARERHPNERIAFVAEVCAGDDALRREVESLLSYQPQAEGFMESPVAASKASEQGSLVGSKVGHYEVLALIGVGGMGEVYRARDTKLGRDIAMKVLPDPFARDPDRLIRFRREGRLLASLNHPHIAQIYGLEESNGTRCIVMELVEGKTLEERLRRGPLPVAEALEIAKQIAEALEAAHEQGVIHRDLKPGNVKITSGGTVKVLDFGLAKAFAGEATATDSSNVTTMPEISMPGVILGTPAYMSPEQARGRPVDRRTDIWSFGCVLYEMLTGRQVFPVGETVSDTLAGVLERDPDWHSLPAATPQKIRTLLERCLRKDAARRLRDIGDAKIEIEEAGNEPAAAALASAAPAPSRRREVLLWRVLALALFLTTAGVVLRFALAPAPKSPAVRFDVQLPEGTSYAGMALSPDGRKLAFVANSQLWVRPIESSTSQALPGTEGASNPFWSADGQYIGFFTPPNRLQKVLASGGPPQLLSTLESQVFSDVSWQATWNGDGIILAAGQGNPYGRADGLWQLGGRSAATRQILQVPAAGGEAVAVTTLDASRNETFHQYPRFLPDGRHYLYLATSGSESVVYVGELNSTERRLLPGIASMVEYSSTGHLVFLRNGSLMAQAFDVGKLEMSGDAFPIAELGSALNAVTGPYSVSMTGDLAYRVLPVTPGGGSQLAWFDRAGKQVAPVGPVGEYRNIALSTDGKFVAFQRGAPADIWVLDIQKNITSRVTSHPSNEAMPVWSPDGRSIVFASNRDGSGLFELAFGLVGEEKLLRKGTEVRNPTDWSRDGRYIAYDGFAVHDGVANTTNTEMWAILLSDASKPIRVTEMPFQELAGRISPDGRWIVYRSDEPGRSFPSLPAPPIPAYIYIQSFPQPGTKRQLSDGNGFMPRWSRDGKEVFYLAPDLTLMSVPVKASGDSLETGTPVSLFKMPLLPSSIGTTRNYETSPDGRFLVNVTAPAGPVSNTPTTPITVILNWASALEN